MSRRELREQLFKLLFRIEFTAPEDMPEQKEIFFTDEGAAQGDDAAYVSEKFDKIKEKLEEIDGQINEKAEKWTTSRMGKVDLTLIRLAVYEILFDDSVPAGVAINEAVELAKKFGQEFCQRYSGKICCISLCLERMMERIYSVTQINTYVKNMFTYDPVLQAVSVKGEVSNCTYHRSNHIYFTLKDGKSTISCVMFAGNRRGLNFEMKEGMQVVVKGNIDVFERDGKYQLYARTITREGIGELYEQFEALKKDLEERGMFDPCYKQPIPKYIKTLGVVTAPTGAAIRDIINITTKFLCLC